MVEGVFIFPFIIIGRIIAKIKPLDKEYRLFFFFPFYHTGGAELFNMRLAHAVGGKDAIIFFTRRSVNDRFYKEFEQSGCELKDISKYTDNKWLYFFNLVYRGIITGYINSQQHKPIVFNGQSNFGYKLSPWVNRNIRQLEFIHTFSSFSYIRVPFIPFYTETISSSEKTINDHLAFYRKWSVPNEFTERFRYILYGIDLPTAREKIVSPAHLSVLYAGRGGPEKRVHLIAEMAKRAKEKDNSIQFLFMGDVKSAIPENLRSYCILLGNQSDPDRINEIYSQSDILLITSLFEGFPLVVMEAMARGLAIISTPVGDVPKHVKNGINGFIIEELNDEEKIVALGLNYILELRNNKARLQEMAKANIGYASAHFGVDKFNAAFRELLGIKK